MRKVGFIPVAVALAIGVGYYIWSPYLALHSLKTAIHEGDAAALDDRIDFAHLRESLKAQFNAVMLKETASGLGDNPFGVLALGLVSKLVDGMVDSFVTPAGLASLAQGNRPQTTPSQAASTSSGHSAAPDELFVDARVTRESFSRFSAWVPDNSGAEIRFVFRRQGLTWRLTNIFFPLPLNNPPGVETPVVGHDVQPGAVPVPPRSQREALEDERQREREQEGSIKVDYISQHLELYDVSARYIDSLLYGRVPGVLFKVRNRGERSLDKVVVTVYFKDAQGSVIAEEDYIPVLVSAFSLSGANKPLKPGYVWQMERDKFYAAKSVPSEWAEGSVAARITDIRFTE